MGEIPQWALEKARKLSEAETRSTWRDASCYASGPAFARYIAAHEQPPVDPLRAALDETYDAVLPYRRDFGNEGELRDRFVVELRAALQRRGIELSSKGDSDRG